MESRVVVGMENTITPQEPAVKPPIMARDRRQAWAQSRDSTGQRSKLEQPDRQKAPPIQKNGHTETPSEQPGQVPNKIATWLNECTSNGASLDDQTASPSRGALKNGCSFEDDLSLGAEANHLQNKNNTVHSSFDVANHKRNQYKTKGSMNSTGSGKSSTVSSISELLELYEEDPIITLLNLGFGQEEPDLSMRVPSRFLSSTSSARGIDTKVYLAAQQQRMEMENPNYALTSRFRQIQVLTTVANEFFQLYSQVSGQPVQQISMPEQGGVGKESVGGFEASPLLKKNNSAQAAAKVLLRKISKPSMLLSPNKPEDAHSALQPRQQTPPNHTLTNGHTRSAPAQEGRVSVLPTVEEKTGGSEEADQLIDTSPEQSSTAAEHQLESANPSSAQHRADVEEPQPASEENSSSCSPEEDLSTLTSPPLAKRPSNNTDSFEIEEISAKEDVTHKRNELSRSESQQSDSSGFVEFKKERSDSRDSETTVTSQPSQDVTTPHALDQPAFDLPSGRKDAVESADPINPDESSSSTQEAAGDATSELVLQIGVDQLLTSTVDPETSELEKTEAEGNSDPNTEMDTSQSMPVFEEELQQELEPAENLSVGSQEQHHTENSIENVTDNEPSTPKADDEPIIEPIKCENPGLLHHEGPSSPVFRALTRAKQRQNTIASQSAASRRGRRGFPLQRSSSLPSSLISPSRVVSSVRIQLGHDTAFCSPPSFTYKFVPEGTEEKEVPDNEEETESGQRTCVSTLYIKPPFKTPSGLSPKRPGSSSSLCSISPSPDQEDSTQSVPKWSRLSQQAPITHPNPQSRSLGPPWFPIPSPTPGSIPYSSPIFHQHHPPYYSPPHRLNPFPTLDPYSSQASPSIPATSSLSLDSRCYCDSPLGYRTPPTHPQSYNYPYRTLPFAVNAYPPFSRYPASEPGLHQSFTPPAAPGPGYHPPNTEIQLRRVLHDIRETVHQLSQSRVNSPDLFGEHKAAYGHQPLEEFQQKRRSLNVFRRQMMDLELSIMRQQAPVYNHMSPADRLEAEQLQSLRSAVREELQELEQQMEDRLMELTQHLCHRGLHRGDSVDSFSSVSALRAMEPMSDLLREQYSLRSELEYNAPSPSPSPSTRSSSPVRERLYGERGDGTQKQYRASINLTPMPPPRPNASTEREEVDQGRDAEGVEEGKAGKEEAASEEEGATEALKGENLQQIIREIRESMAQEIRREIYSELLSAVSPRGSALSAKQQPL
ncbi:protein ITPRID2 isoform X2 [Oryzias melastigma]|uniref:ITPR interacting domain containing 2 n=1 Tax=Oryzias melastigma TaxID=30732 RepID=A0A3B3DMY8_ORYME|nr:protein ITPRID2 isoform X2 [Oryzias melastigma]